VGHRWLDLLIAGIAILISCISLYVAVQNTRTQDRLLAASSWPYLQYSTGNRGPGGEERVSMNVSNKGSGPALLRSVRIYLDDREVRGWTELMQACCGLPKPPGQEDYAALSLVSSPLEGSVLAAGEELTFVGLTKSPSNSAAWNKLNQARWNIRIDACYCSPLGDCWRSDLKREEPRRVRTCEATRGYVE
jgi:hypothetical protein